jgi:hypothetical protein
MAKFKVTNTDTSGQIHDRYARPQYINGAYTGGTGGNTSQAGRQIQPVVFVTGGSQTTGSILAQKGRKSFRVTDATNFGDCTLVTAGTLTAGQMSIQVNLATMSGATVTSYTASTSTVAYVTGFTSAGPIALTAGQVVTGTAFTGTVTIGSVVSASNIALSYTSQTNANASGIAVSTTVYASRISNRFVWDFGSNGVLSTNINGGYNPNRYAYHLAAPDSTYVEVKYA